MRTLLAMIIVVGALSATATWAKAPVGSGKVFSGSEGEQVALVPLTEKEGMEVLLYIQGTGGAFDGKVLLHEIVEQQGQVDYRTQFRGEPFLTLTLRVKADGQRRYQLNMPGRRLDIPLSFDEARTRALDAESVYALHQKQKADGTLARLMSLDREARMAAQDQALAKAVESLNAACGTSVIATIDWSTISDEVLKERSISSFCKAPISALKRLCSQDTAKQTLQAEVRTLSCRFGEALKLELTSGHVSWTTSPGAKNHEAFAIQYFYQRLGDLPLGRTSVCTDGKGHYIVLGPHEIQSHQLFYGDGKTFFQVPLPPSGLSGSHFLDPRFPNKSAASSFRGADMRVYSEVLLDSRQKTCALRCGERKIPLNLLELAEAKKLLEGAKYERTPQEFVPYALLRDTRGLYYLVERGFHPEDQKRFRIYVGLKGDLKRQEMTDVVSDSEGQIFSTKGGDLRLVLDRKEPSMWIEDKQRLELREVPVSENLPLIYTELGVYAGARLGTPCDDQ